jgi:hypothetical protein
MGDAGRKWGTLVLKVLNDLRIEIIKLNLYPGTSILDVSKDYNFRILTRPGSKTA